MAKICQKCGYEAQNEDVYCTGCGQKLDIQPLLNKSTWSSNSYEQEQTETEETISFLGYLFMFLILMIPIVNVILLIVWAVSGHNKNRKNFARAALVYMVIGLLFASFIGAATFKFVAQELKNSIDSQYIPYEFYENELPFFYYEWSTDTPMTDAHSQPQEL